MRRTILLTAIVAVIAASAALAKSFPATIALPNGWQPEGIAVGDGSTFYVGSIPTGAVYRGDLRTGKGATLVQGATGRAAIGVEHDRGRIFVAGGMTGKAFVYNARTGALVREVQLPTGGAATFVNDVVVTKRAAFFTDSNRDVLYRLGLSKNGAPAATASALQLTGDFQLVGGFNLNGIDATPDGKTLVVVQSVTGKLFRVVAASGVTKAIDLGGALVTNGDGLLLHGRTLYVVQNRDNKIAVVALAKGLASGRVARAITNPAFDVPTTIDRQGSRIYAVNARFGTRGRAVDDVCRGARPGVSAAVSISLRMQGKAFELGIYTFAELTPDPDTGRVVTPAERLRDLLEEVELADQVGLDVFGVGEHHRPDFAVSAPAVVLAAAADAHGADPADERRHRAELGRPGPRLPGLRDARPDLRRARRDHGRARVVHRVVPAVRLRPRRLRRALRREARPAARAARGERVTWSGGTARRSTDRGVYPRPLQDPLPVWVAVGGTPESVVRAGTLGLPLALAIIGGVPERFAPLRGAAPPRGARAPGTTRRRAQHQLARLRRRDGRSGADVSFPAVRDDDEPDRPRARLAADDPRRLRGGRARCAARSSSAARRRWSRRSSSSTSSSGTTASCCSSRVGTMPHAELMRAIELFGTEVAPVVRAELSRRAGRPASVA